MNYHEKVKEELNVVGLLSASDASCKSAGFLSISSMHTELNCLLSAFQSMSCLCQETAEDRECTEMQILKPCECFTEPQTIHSAACALS